LDTDYGPFVDDGFALGLALQANDVFDLQMVMATSIEVDLSAKCMAEHVNLAGHPEVIVGQGASTKNVTRAGVCALDALVGFALRDKCINVTHPFEQDGVKAAAERIMDSNRDDWVYITTGPTTSVRALKEQFPEAAEKIDMMVVMGSNFCDEYEPYVGVPAPVQETNTACDPESMDIMSSVDGVGKNLFFTPVAINDALYQDDYAKVLQAANEGVPGPKAMIDFYKAWSEAGRADDSLLIYAEAMAFDPEKESPPLWDPAAVMMAIQLLTEDTSDDYLDIYDVQGVDFDSSAYTLLPESFNVTDLPDSCPSLVDAKFTLSEENKRPAKVALGFTSTEAKEKFYREMARRMASEIEISGAWLIRATHMTTTAISLALSLVFV
jgi:inosine-uridine nucleoside N-ribohydrolase